MAKMKVIGISERNKGEKSQKTGKAYDGTSLHCIRDKSNNVVIGQAVEVVYVNHLSSIPTPVINVGDIINVEYAAKTGYIDYIEVIKPAAAQPAKTEVQ